MYGNNNVPAAHSVNQRKNQWGVICVVLFHIQKMGQKIYKKKKKAEKIRSRKVGRVFCIIYAWFALPCLLLENVTRM